MRQRRTRHTSDWTAHEFEAPALHVQVRRLIEQAGSPELARQAIDAAAKAILVSQARQGSRSDNLSRSEPPAALHR